MLSHDCWWFLMISDDFWWFLMVSNDFWWFLMISTDFWWLLMISDQKNLAFPSAIDIIHWKLHASGHSQHHLQFLMLHIGENKIGIGWMEFGNLMKFESIRHEHQIEFPFFILKMLQRIDVPRDQLAVFGHVAWSQGRVVLVAVWLQTLMVMSQALLNENFRIQ